MFNEEERKYFLSKLIDFLKIPSVSATGEGIREASSWLKEFMKELGIKSEIVETNGHPVIYGEINNGGNKTLLVYNHYDVQPVDPLNEWKYPPFSATIDGDYIYARGASDNKGTLMARLLALTKYKGNLNFKFVIEGEEEIGSIHLPEFVEKNKEKLNADGVIMEGAGLDSKGRPMIVLGVKGLVYVEIIVKTGERDVHSSNAPVIYNPVWELIKILNSIYDGEKVKLRGFYDNIEKLPLETERLLESYDLDIETFKKSLGAYELKYKDKESVVYSLFTEPTCNIDGIVARYIGEGSKTIVPSIAKVKIDFRLVPNQDPVKIYNLLVDHLNHFKNVKIINHGLEKPVRTSPNTKIVKAMVSSAIKVYQTDPVILPNSAGTQPMGVFYDLGIREIVSAIGVGTPSSNAHAPNENIKIENFYKAIQHSLEFYKEYEKE
ncbi:M20/M25/M40 family metallo-hydrolase [Sulfurisphaera javensis]|uniref:M20/M25/M40 family metallo-hydrolase n=1 Tax=Sulfurisphaera javensis TaxID=2049879 RepID=A0AAT9GQK6_9CREN